MANYAHYCLHKLRILPDDFVELSDDARGFIIASIDLKIDSEKKERAKMKKK